MLIKTEYGSNQNARKTKNKNKKTMGNKMNEVGIRLK